MPTPYHPPFTITPRQLTLVGEICERIGRWGGREFPLSPQLRKANRIQSIQASLAIENNSLGIEQVTAILEGKRVIGSMREIQEVRNAIECYDQLPRWKPAVVEDFLAAHGLMMKALVDHAGVFRPGGVGIYRGSQLIHMAPPAERVEHLVGDLFEWLARTDLHPLIASSILHYEIEFIHPFSDGNGRLGRLWQSLTLSQWHAELAYLPVEGLIRDHQVEYYEVLGAADRLAEATPFVEFMLTIIRETLDKAPASDQVGDQVSDQVKALLKAYGGDAELTSDELLRRLGLRHKPTFRKNHLNPALLAGLIEMTEPDSPRSPTQRYRLTREGRRLERKGDV
jgi:Fic family protein